MPTPAPFTPALEEPPARGTAELPVASCNRLAERRAERFGAIASTSARAASSFRPAAGTIAAIARTDW